MHGVADKIEQIPGGSQWWNEKLGEWGLPTTETVHPTSTSGKLLQQGVRGAAAFATPGIAGKMAAARGLPAVGEALSSMSPGGPLSSAAYGAAAGAAGEGAAEIAPESKIARPIGEMVGALAPAGLMAAGAGAARGMGNLIPPLTEASRNEAASRAAAGAFDKAAVDPNAAASVLEQRLAADNAEIVAGSKPTTAELANDPGLLALQRARERLPPEQSDVGNAVREQRIANNEARTQSLEGMAPSTATPEATQAVLRQHLADIDASHAASIDAERKWASAVREPITPTMTPEEQGQAARGAVEAERAPEDQALADSVQSARQSLDQAAGRIGGTAAVGTAEERAAAPAQYGAQMRDPAQEAYLAERAKLNKMREAIDPEGTMGMRPDAIKEARQQIETQFPAEGGTNLSSAEQHLYDTVDTWGDLIPLDRAFQLRANINGRLRNVPDQAPQEALRLQMLKKGVDQAITDAASDANTLEQAGTINVGRPALADRLGGLETSAQIGPSFAQDVAAAYAASASPATRRLGRGISATANTGNAPIREGAVPGSPGGGGPQGGRPGGGAGDTGVPQVRGEPDLTPLTPEAREQFAQWNREYAEMSRRFRGETGGQLHAVGKMLQKGGAYDSYRLADSEVPWIFANGGKTSKEAVERFLDAAPLEAHAALDDAFAFSLRRAAQREDGTLDLGAYRKWLAPREGALSARPELLERFNTAAQAQKRLNEISQNLAEHEASHPLKPGWGDSGVLRQFWKPGPQGAESMRRYMEITGGRADAVDAAVDYAALDFASKPGVIVNGEIAPKAAEAWIGQHQHALSVVPGLEDKFSSAVEAQKAVQEAVARHLDARKEFTDSVAGAFIQDDPERAILRVFSGPDRAQKAQSLMGLVTGSQAAREGIQRAAIDHILSKFSGAPIAGAETGALKAQALQNFIAENRPVLDVLFPNGLAKNFDALAEDLRRSQLVQNARMPGGSDTMELANRAGGHEHNNGFGTIAAAVLGEHAGQHILGGVMGGPIGLIATPIASRWLKGKSTALQTAANSVLDHMLLDPQFAVDTRRAYGVGAASRTSILNRLGQRAVQSTIQAARSEDLQPAIQHRAQGGAVVTHEAHLHREAKKADRNPSPGQIEAGNYRKAHVVVHGLPITIENAKGSFRRGVDHNGKPWSVRMPVAYGYLKGTRGADWGAA